MTDNKQPNKIQSTQKKMKEKDKSKCDLLFSSWESAQGQEQSILGVDKRDPSILLKNGGRNTTAQPSDANHYRDSFCWSLSAESLKNSNFSDPR